jgi:hypothetical protein
MESNGSDRQTSRSSLTESTPAGLMRRDFCRLLGATAVALGFGLKQSLAGVAPLNAVIAEPIIVDCPEQHCVIEVDSNGVEQSRYYHIGRHRGELRGRVLTLDDVCLIMPIAISEDLPYSPVERDFINRFTTIMEQWCSEGLSPQERCTLVDCFAWEVELRF